MPRPDLIIRGNRVLASPQSSASPEEIPAAIHILDGKIIAITSYEDIPPGVSVLTSDRESVVAPGLVDSHVHVNEPGRTDWEGFVSATRAAAAGGVTTIVDMPLNSIPATTTLEGYRTKLNAAAGQCLVDVGFWGGVVPGNTKELAGLLAAGVRGFKCFLIDSGVAEFPSVTENHLREALPELKRLGTVLIVHAELPGPCQNVNIQGEASNYQTFLSSRPRAAENQAVELMINLGREFGVHVHVVHHSSADALSPLKRAKEEGVRISAETCPHYLYFAAEDVAAGATEFKCCPPIRERENRERLWDALKDGAIDMIVSDHSPCPPEMKERDSGDFLAAWGGISSLQLRLPVVWTEASRRGFPLTDLVKWLCWAPARLVGLERQKGALAVGCDADIVIWNTEQQFRVEEGIIHHRHKLTPYQGELLRGMVQKTFLRGRQIYCHGEFVSGPSGLLIT